MNIEKIELVLNRNLHFETEYILVLWYTSNEERINSQWKPSSEEWGNILVISHSDDSVTVVYEKRNLDV